MARERISFQGLPARICRVGLGQRHRLGLAFNETVGRGELAAPVVIGRDHLDRVRAGTVRLSGRDIAAMPAHARVNHGIGLVPEGRRVFADLAVDENITVGGSRLPPARRF